MPLFKGLSSKSTPKKAIDYITRKDKAAYISVRNLFEDEDYAEQFADTMRRFGKGKKFDERKYYHFKLSCARKDNVSPQTSALIRRRTCGYSIPRRRVRYSNSHRHKDGTQSYYRERRKPYHGKEVENYGKRLYKNERRSQPSGKRVRVHFYRLPQESAKQKNDGRKPYHYEGRHVVERRFTGSHRRSKAQFVHAGRIYIAPCVVRRNGNAKQDGIFLPAPAKEKSHSRAETRRKLYEKGDRYCH